MKPLVLSHLCVHEVVSVRKLGIKVPNDFDGAKVSPLVNECLQLIKSANEIIGVISAEERQVYVVQNVDIVTKTITDIKNLQAIACYRRFIEQEDIRVLAYNSHATEGAAKISTVHVSHARLGKH